MKLAIIGLGAIAKYQLEAARACGEYIEIVAVCDIDAKKALAFRDVVFYPSVERLLATADVDVVLISTPTKTHYELARTVLEKRRSVLIEKPACLCREELAKLVELKRQQQVSVNVAFHAAFAGEVEWWFEHRGALATQYGKLNEILMGFFDPYIDYDGTTEYAGLGGSWFDSGINALSVLGRFADPSTVRIDDARMFRSRNISADQARASIRLSFPIESYRCGVTIDTSWLWGNNRKLSVLSYERATVILDHSLEQAIIKSTPYAADTERVVFANERNRLVNHYIGVFNDLKKHEANGTSNIEHAVQLHNILFSAVELAEVSQQPSS